MRRSSNAIRKAIEACEDGAVPAALWFEAIGSRSVEATAAALQRGADLEQRRNGKTALAHAARMGGNKNDLALAEFLLSKGADPNGPGVMLDCRVEMLDKLIARGGRVNGNPQDENPLIAVVAYRGKPDKALALIERGADIHVTDENGITPLCWAARNGASTVFKALLARGADPLAVDPNGRSVLRNAIECLATGLDSQKPGARSIINAIKDRLPAQPEDLFLIALTTGDVADVKRMLSDGLDPNTEFAGAIGVFGLSQATARKEIGDLWTFLARGIEQSTIDRLCGGSTSLMWAVALERVEIVRVLLENGADPNRRNADGMSAADLSIKMGNLRIKVMLGTARVHWKEHEAGTLSFTPSLEREQSREVGETRKDRLGIDLEFTGKRLESCVKVGGYRETTEGTVESIWDMVSIHHVLEDEEQKNSAATKTVSAGDAFFFGPSGGIPKICHEKWMLAYPCVLAAASWLGDVEALRRFAEWVLIDRPRGARSNMYNPHYFRWPLYKIWAGLILERPAEPMFEEMIAGESDRMAKFLLDALRFAQVNDAKRWRSSLRKSVRLHQKFAVHRGTVRAKRVLLSDISFTACETQRRFGMPILDGSDADWILSVETTI